MDTIIARIRLYSVDVGLQLSEHEIVHLAKLTVQMKKMLGIANETRIIDWVIVNYPKSMSYPLVNDHESI